MLSRKKILAVKEKLLSSLDLPGAKKIQGKVRDIYRLNGKRILITTDRISAFDRVLGLIPYKGQVLNLLSAFWFRQTEKICENHLLSLPHPNVSLVKEAKPYPVEMVVRGYITGVTSTSLWRAYEKGERVIYGIKFPENLRKNQKLPQPVITPTTKAAYGFHDERLTLQEIQERNLLPKKILEEMVEISLALYQKGSEICQKQNFILVDTKYEFGDFQGKLILIDEVHTPDSSRFWQKEDYEKKFPQGKEPENFDKEFFRKWYVERGYLGEGQPPEMPVELQVETCLRYLKLYELVTGEKFSPFPYPREEGIMKAILPLIKGGS